MTMDKIEGIIAIDDRFINWYSTNQALPNSEEEK